MKKKRLIPFSATFAGMSLKGSAYKQAEACYYYEGEELERALIEADSGLDDTQKEQKLKWLDVNYGKLSKFEYELWKLRRDGKDTPEEILNLKYDHNQITQEEFDEKYIEITTAEGLERDIARLRLQLDKKQITEKQFEKECATLRNEPYIYMLDDGFDHNQGISGYYFEFDWNDLWITYLRMNEYEGDTDEEIVQRWFTSVCKSVVDADNQGTPPVGANVFAMPSRLV